MLQRAPEMCFLSFFLSATAIAFSAVLMVPEPSVGQIDVKFEPIPNTDINSPNPVQALNVAYDEINPNRQAFHLFLPDTKGSFPLVIYYHGGGFTGGHRDTVFVKPRLQNSMKFFLENGIGFASVGYRLIETDQADEQGVIKCLGDSKRALQFIRHYSAELKIDPDRVALMGGSAGAGTALWLSTRDDMAEPTSPDRVLRESTRFVAVQLSGSQATYDIPKWESVVYKDFGTTVDEVVKLVGFDRISNFYGGIDSIDQLTQDPDLIQYRQDVDMLYHLSSDDPPIYLESRSSAELPEQDLFHHGVHSITIQTQAIAAGIPEVKARINFMEINTSTGECADSFLARHLGVALELKGDVNNDSDVNLLDVAPFIDVLSGAAPFDSKADVNCDGRVDLLDVNRFIELLSN